jgi:hypothetical protein
MRWAEKRIQQYREGQKATCLEKLALEYGHPVNCTASIIAIVLLGYGLWIHSYDLIIAGVVVGLLGYLYCWLKK